MPETPTKTPAAEAPQDPPPQSPRVLGSEQFFGSTITFDQAVELTKKAGSQVQREDFDQVRTEYPDLNRRRFIPHLRALWQRTHPDTPPDQVVPYGDLWRLWYRFCFDGADYTGPDPRPSSRPSPKSQPSAQMLEEIERFRQALAQDEEVTAAAEPPDRS